MAGIRKPTVAEALLTASQPYQCADGDLLESAVVLERYDYAHVAGESGTRRSGAP